MTERDPSASTDAICTRVVVEGRVQGVGYRVSCARRARQAGLAGSVRNLPDGRVEAIFEGSAEQVGELVTWCGRGPSAARVDTVRISDAQPTGSTQFTIG